MLKKYLTLLILIGILAGCGSASDHSASLSNNSNNEIPGNLIKLKPDRLEVNVYKGQLVTIDGIEDFIAGDLLLTKLFTKENSTIKMSMDCLHKRDGKCVSLFSYASPLLSYLSIDIKENEDIPDSATFRVNVNTHADFDNIFGNWIVKSDAEVIYSSPKLHSGDWCTNECNPVIIETVDCDAYLIQGNKYPILGILYPIGEHTYGNPNLYTWHYALDCSEGGKYLVVLFGFIGGYAHIPQNDNTDRIGFFRGVLVFSDPKVNCETPQDRSVDVPMCFAWNPETVEGWHVPH